VEKGFVDFKAMDAQGKTPLNCACVAGKLDCVKYLVKEKNADCQTKDTQGKTPLDLAVEKDRQDVIAFLEMQNLDSTKFLGVIFGSAKFF
jgi:ankyrin repeat protein